MYRLDISDTFLLLYLFTAKIIPALVTYFADKYFNIEIKFKSLSVLSASIQNVTIKWSACEINIAEIALRLKFFNRDFKNPLCLYFEDVIISQTHDNNKNNNIDRVQKYFKVKQNNDEYDQKSKWKRMIPPILMMTLKFLQVRIKNLSMTVLNDEGGPVSTTSIHDIEILFDGCVIRQRRTLLIALALQHIKLEYIAYNKQNPSRKPEQACLAEIILDLSFETEIIWENRILIFKKQHVSINNVQVTFYGGLFDIIEHTMLHTKSTSNTMGNAIDELQQQQEHQKYQELSMSKQPTRMEILIAKLTPHVMSLHAEQIEIKSLNNKESSYHYHLLLYSIDMKVKINHNNTNISNNSSSMKGKIGNLRIYTPSHEVLYLKQLIIDMRVNDEGVVEGSMTLDTIDAVYSHEDIYGWFLKIFTASMKSSRREMILRSIEIGNQKFIEFYHSEFVQNIFAHIVLNFRLELRNVVLILELDDQISSINAEKIRLQVSQLDKLRESPYENYTMNLLFKKRHWHVDTVSESSLCWYMGSKYPRSSGEKKSAYVRGCALYLGNAFVRVGSNQNEEFRVNLRINILQTEYSNKFTQFTVQTAKSFKDFINLFSKLKRKKGKKEVAVVHPSEKSSQKLLKQFLTKVSLNLKIVDCSCFFINRHDVCTFINLSNVLSNDNFNYNLDTLAVSTIDFRKYDSRLSDLDEFSTTYISTSLLKVKLEMTDQIQLCIDFAEKLDCSWNAHFIRHTLSLVRDFRRFKKNLEEALEIEPENKTLLSTSLPLGLDIKKLRNISVKHADVNVDKLMLLINELTGENLFFYNYFN
ncbi:hypothetical protein PVAND_007242 [Polypedilum vanderplanki]|uniref:Uncharacterized protein n=1 Tax=Polypedilum vanderplanki TaxID=319348 RepID=A0A9J6C5M5_POLVA|nr:hypothetical protein PVAND_007242 [Polypedilum vanderplanki]